MLTKLNLIDQGFNITSRLPKVETIDFEYELINFRKIFDPGFHEQESALNGPAINYKVENKQVLGSDNAKIFETEEKFESLPKIIDSDIDYQFELSLNDDFGREILKRKFFSFRVILCQMSDLVFPSNEVVEVELVVYDNEKTIISKNMQGYDILKGNYKQSMHFFKPENKHMACYRIQITEVSSHFINKTVNLMIRAKNNAFLMKTGWQIKPIILEGLIIKSKKNIIK